MKVKFKNEGSNIIVSFEDLINRQLDLSHVTDLRNRFKSTLAKKSKIITLDFGAVDYIDSAIIGFIVDSFNLIRNNEGELKIINVNRNVFEIFEMINLTKFLDIRKR
ncbi:MAG: STAS domain-containing protein [Spirochaetes bacterium]|nr:STAS domain-containing protein [Spirochaetota bacterium]